MKPLLSLLKKLYIENKKSSFEISCFLNCSEHKVNYWLKKYNIPKRSISEAIYIKSNPKGDPFKIKTKLTKEDEKLMGLGLGLYWGEGNKRNKVSIRLGNTEPGLIKNFMEFLIKICGVKKKDINFNLLIFSDISPITAKKFWIKKLKINPSQIRGKITVIKSGSIGTYRQKSKYGVLILQYHNRKLRDIICDMIENLK
ncbi:hypothetical protein HZB06_01725 [Candidatus Wolfebacteria bacterium]|nr:hypothetical protein [Candidatus Wolfebacteria bacterium]